jgi:hypothetical protein
MVFGSVLGAIAMVLVVPLLVHETQHRSRLWSIER